MKRVQMRSKRQAGYFPNLRTDGRPQRWGHQRRGGILRVDSGRQRASVQVCHRDPTIKRIFCDTHRTWKTTGDDFGSWTEATPPIDGELRNGCQYSHDGLLCSGRETADLVNWVYNGFWLRRALHERTILDCQCVHAQVGLPTSQTWSACTFPRWHSTKLLKRRTSSQRQRMGSGQEHGRSWLPDKFSPSQSWSLMRSCRCPWTRSTRKGDFAAEAEMVKIVETAEADADTG